MKNKSLLKYDGGTKVVLKKIYKKINSAQRLFFPSKNQKLRLHYAENYETAPIDSNVILYETRDGKSIVDSPLAIFKYLAENETYLNFNHIWVVDESIEMIKESFPLELKKKAQFVYRGSIEYVDALLKAKYLISNSTFESFFVKRPGQVYINTWHGTPLKYMGFDIPGSLAHSQNVLRNFLMTDYLLSPNNHTSNIFIDSYKLKGAYEGQILEGGYPRIDFTLTNDTKYIEEKLSSFGIILDSTKKTLLYCPTWKGQNVHQATDDIEQIIHETLKIKDEFNEQYNVLVKVHPFIFSEIKDDERLNGVLISDLIDPNQVLSMTDLLITDYSSIFFDFLVTKRPIIFYAWDKDLYSFERGMYLTDDELPGPTAENIGELISLIHSVESEHKKYLVKYNQLAKRMTPYDDGAVTKKYVEYIFDNKNVDNMVIHHVNSQKQKLLIFPGGMRNNGITSSFLNLTNNIDYSKYDVTVIANPPKGAEINNNFKAMNDNVRPLFRFGIDILTRKEKMLNKKFADQGVSVSQRKDYPEIGYKREMNRLTGNLTFDVAIDFSGYSYFWGRHILASNAKKYVAFMHNDLYSDSQREVNGKMPMLRDLNGLFSIYYKFDKLLSVSPMTRDVNFENLHNYVKKEQMSYVYNTINIDKILEKKQIDEAVSPLKVTRNILRFKVSGEIEYAKNIAALETESFMKTNVRHDSIVVQHAEMVVFEQKFYKTSVDNEYLGWINERYVLPKINQVQKIEDFHGFATVARFLNYPIWKDIKTNTEKDEILTYIKPFANRYLEIEKVAYTDAGRYFLVKYNKKTLGWVSPKPLMRVHETKKMSPINAYFLSRMSKMDVSSPVTYTDSVKVVESYARIINQRDIEMWTAPKGTTGSENITVSDEYFEMVFRMKEICIVGEKKYVKLSFPNNAVIGYIDSEDIKEITETEFDKAQYALNQLESLDYVLPKIDLARQNVPHLDNNFFNVVNMGRLSPEKNQKSLIEGFARFRNIYPKSRLFILGKGPLENDLIECVKENHQEGFVFLLGHLSSPFNFMKETDLFILPSFYEGQPMVLLESLTLGMNILASNIPANINVIGANEEYGLLTNGTSVEDIEDGLERAKLHQESFKKFNPYLYNEQAINSFYHEIEVNK